MSPRPLFGILWLAWGVSWLLAAGWSSAPEKRAPLGRELGSRVALAASFVLLAVPARRSGDALRLWHVTRAEAWACVALIFAGLSFCWWARVHLGRLWSGRVTKKADHTVVDTGPYRIVRHPIYTGILLAVLATACAKGTVLGWTAFALATVALAWKARLEEAWLREELGPGAYDAYARRVPMLVPFGPRR